MKKVILLLLAFSFLAVAQDKKFTSEDMIINTLYDLAPESYRNITWIDDDEFSYVAKVENESVLYKASVEESAPVEIIKFQEFKEKLKEIDVNVSFSFPAHKWEEGLLTFWVKKFKLAFNTKDKTFTKLFELKADATNKDLSPDGKYTAFTVENDLFVAEQNSKPVEIAKSEAEHIVYGQSVHRNEFGIHKGIYWAPDSRHIAFYRKDESMVDDFPIVDFLQVPAKLEAIKYPMAGRKSHHVTLGVYSVESKETIYLNTGEPKEQYLTSITWSPDSKHIYIGVLNRDQNHVIFKQFNAENGKFVKVVFEEKQDKYVEPEMELLFLPEDDDKFLWLSERDGFLHYHMYNTDGEYIKQVTTAKAPVMKHVGFTKDGKYLVYVSNIEDPKSHRYYKTNIETGETVTLTPENGRHSVKYNLASGAYIDSYSNLNTPHTTNLYNNDNRLVRTLIKAETPYKDYAVCKTEFVKIKNVGVDLECRIIYPNNFDKAKKYPVIVYVYGGPHAQLVVDEFPRYRYQLWFQRMAQEGYVVFTVDNRGSGNRGRDFEQAVHRQMGTPEISDQIAGLDYLKSLGFVDENRVGVFGWSYGGFMTTSLMLRTDAFKVGVAGGAVIDWDMYEVMYTERYMDSPEQNPEGYKKANLLNYVENLKGKKLLMVHGTNDPTVVWQHSLKFAKACADKLIPLDYFPYVSHPHGVRGQNAVHMYNKITQYFLDNL